MKKKKAPPQEQPPVEFAPPAPEVYTGAGIWGIVKAALNARRDKNPATKFSQEDAFAAIKHFVGEPVNDGNNLCITDRLDAIPDELAE